jgi:hypothetical protein
MNEKQKDRIALTALAIAIVGGVWALLVFLGLYTKMSEGTAAVISVIALGLLVLFFKFKK